jgi:hypothetical protein
LGIFNSATTPTATIAVFNVRITSSMA